MSLTEFSDYLWLVSDDAVRWLEEVSVEAQISATLIKRLRNDLGTNRSRLLCEQVELRRRARVKFSRASQMFLTRKGLEQSTSEVLAKYKARRFSGNVVADGCCGIGGDLIGHGPEKTVYGIETDEVTALFAQANLSLYCGQGRVQKESVESFAIEGVDQWHLDPDRRVAGARTTTLEMFSPGNDLIEDWLTRVPRGCLKLAPATTPPADWIRRGQIEFLGSGRECQQQLIWFGDDNAGKPSQATIVDESGHSQLEARDEIVSVADEPLRYVYAPHSVVKAAHMVDSLAISLKQHRLTRQASYLTADTLTPSPFSSSFEVLAALPFDRRKVQQTLRHLDMGRLEVKKSGVDIDPNALQKKWSGKRGQDGVVLLYPKHSSVMAIIGRRVNS